MARFAFTIHRDKEFIFETTDEARIAHARRILSGAETHQVHVMGRIVKTPAPYNPGWSYHLDPATITFFAVAIEVCDASASYLEDHLDEACGAFLPGCHWCPWSSKLTREVT
ncbi:BP74-related protein [Sorangium sp. So ce394]|uniref:BP74-related protein n=1 Tax=Sorangium sp. So ce394 TaxID=3133310 RepID=UPI003F5C8113